MLSKINNHGCAIRRRSTARALSTGLPVRVMPSSLRPNSLIPRGTLSAPNLNSAVPV